MAKIMVKTINGNSCTDFSQGVVIGGEFQEVEETSTILQKIALGVLVKETKEEEEEEEEKEETPKKGGKK